MVSVPDAMYFNVEVPGSAVNATIPITQGCSCQFSVSPVATTDTGEQYPWHFDDGDEIFMVISINSNTVVRIDPVADTNTTVSFTIASDICDQCTARSTFRIVSTAANGLDTPLVTGSFQRFDGQIELGYN